MITGSRNLEFYINDINYKVDLIQKVDSDPSKVQIIIPTFMPNKNAQNITRVCIESVQKYTDYPYNLWLIDNCSPKKHLEWFLENEYLNIARNLIEPVAPKYRRISQTFKLFHRNKVGKVGLQAQDASYANSIGLEIGIRLLSKDTKYVFTMHSDTLVLKNAWLTYLMSKLNDQTRAISCWKDAIRVNALHIGGMLFDFQLYERFKMNFFHNINNSRNADMPEYDVGDLITIRLLENGFKVMNCRNTYNEPELQEKIPLNNPLKKLHSDRCFDDNWNLFYAHLGRGAPKSFGTYNKEGKTNPEQWTKFAEKYVI
tara:strand:+ start:583 stop:1524 length:942 start_codon:yes stop_codon:yes gene_type:complete